MESFINTLAEWQQSNELLVYLLTILGMLLVFCMITIIFLPSYFCMIVGLSISSGLALFYAFGTGQFEWIGIIYTIGAFIAGVSIVWRRIQIATGKEDNYDNDGIDY